mgnify:CR=1 FL=1
MRMSTMTVKVQHDQDEVVDGNAQQIDENPKMKVNIIAN